ncbi:MAG: riboflavin synthase [Deltaproteobacteria bacterium]|nr:riboflavin synthase [Deltaproteobacteria bacterium]
MFTGIIEAMGSFRGMTAVSLGARLEVDTAMDLTEVKIGDSIAVSGACLTMVDKSARGFAADVSAETLTRTTLGSLRAGDRVNLEKSLRLMDFLGGHLVLGHVDGLGRIAQKVSKSDSILFAFDVEPSLTRYIVEKGSVAVDGISLTVNRCERNRFYVSIIPHTARMTTLEFRQVGGTVNIETDILGKYVEKLLAGNDENRHQKRALNMDFLREHGFLK